MLRNSRYTLIRYNETGNGKGKAMISERRLWEATANKNDRRARADWEGEKIARHIKVDVVAPAGPEQLNFALQIIAVAILAGIIAGAVIGACQL